MILWLPTLALAYLLGSIPFGYLIVLVFMHKDVRATGSGNIGATNVARSAKGLGALTLLLDLLKGFVAVVIANKLSGGTFGAPSDLGCAAAVFAILGHVFPIWLRFKGGKGIATALGVFLVLAPWAGIASFTLFVILVFATRLVSLASVIAAIMIPVFAMLTVEDRSPYFIFAIIFIALLCILKHKANIARLMNRTEPKFGTTKETAA